MRVPQGLRAKGSQRWVQTLVRDFRGILDDAIDVGTVDWKSPLENDDYAEYRDEEFLQRLGIQLPRRALEAFWPHGGPQWDALGTTRSGQAIILEAKAHLGELFSDATAATEASAEKIRRSLAEVMAGLHAKPGLDWSSRFYQYTNRLAHGYLLHELNNVPTRLVFLYLVGDSEMKGPDTRAEWEAAIRVLHEALGLSRTPATFIAEAFIDVRGPKPTVI